MYLTLFIWLLVNLLLFNNREVDFGGIFASTQNTHKHRVIREEENEDAQLSARNGEVVALV